MLWQALMAAVFEIQNVPKKWRGDPRHFLYLALQCRHWRTEIDVECRSTNH